MDPLLDKIEAALGRLEDRVLSELTTARGQPSEDGIASLASESQEHLNTVTMKLWHALEHSGDKVNLSLKTDRHEDIGDRIIIVKKLLEARITVAALDEMMRAPQKNSAGSLALLARRYQTAGNERDLMSAVAEGKAAFRSRELSAAALEALDRAQTPEEIRRKLGDHTGPGSASQFASKDLSTMAPQAKRGIATTPEEIRRKLAEKQSTTSGASSFVARDVAHAAPPETPKPSRKNTAAPPKQAIAQSPEEIRKKLANRSGAPAERASFAAKDIDPVAPPPVREQPAEKPKSAGKAVFESRDLSTPPKKG